MVINKVTSFLGRPFSNPEKRALKLLRKHVAQLESYGAIPNNWHWFRGLLQEEVSLTEHLLKDLSSLYASNSLVPESSSHIKDEIEKFREQLIALLALEKPSPRVQLEKSESVNALFNVVDTGLQKIVLVKVSANDSKRWLAIIKDFTTMTAHEARNSELLNDPKLLNVVIEHIHTQGMQYPEVVVSFFDKLISLNKIEALPIDDIVKTLLHKEYFSVKNPKRNETGTHLLENKLYETYVYEVLSVGLFNISDSLFSDCITFLKDSGFSKSRDFFKLCGLSLPLYVYSKKDNATIYRLREEGMNVEYYYIDIPLSERLHISINQRIIKLLQLFSSSNNITKSVFTTLCNSAVRVSFDNKRGNVSVLHSIAFFDSGLCKDYQTLQFFCTFLDILLNNDKKALIHDTIFPCEICLIDSQKSLRISLGTLLKESGYDENSERVALIVRLLSSIKNDQFRYAFKSFFTIDVLAKLFKKEDSFFREYQYVGGFVDYLDYRNSRGNDSIIYLDYLRTNSLRNIKGYNHEELLLLVYFMDFKSLIKSEAELLLKYARSLHSHEIRLSSVKISFIDRLLTLIIKNSKDTPNELFVLKYVATFICSINNIPEDIFKRHFENLLQVEILLSLNKEHFDRVLSVLGSDKTPFKEPYLQDIDWKEKMRLLYDLFYSNSELIPFYAPYDSLLFLRYLKKDIYNKTNLQQLLSYLMVNRPHSQSVEEIQALKYLPNEIKHRFRNDSCEYIVTQIVDLFPAGDVSVVYLVRQDAIDLESFAWFNNTERTGALNFVRQKIHNNASADDVQMIDILREYIVTEDDAVFDKFKSLYSSLARHNNDLDWIKNNVQFLKSEQRLINNNLYPNGERLTALEVIEKRLLPHLKQFYKVDVTLDTDSRELFSDSKLKKVYDDVVKIIEDSKLVQGARISESNKKKIMSSIGSLRYHLRSKKNTPELVALDIALSLISEKIMEVVHPEDAILLTEQEFIACLKNYEQLLLLVLSTRYITPENDTVPFDNNFTKALISIKRFFYIQKKGSLNFDLVKESFNCANLGIEQYSASFVNTLRNNLKAILWTNDDNDLEVENKVSLYYKTGPLYHLAELVSSLYSKMLGGKGVIVHKGIGFGRFRFVEAPNDEFNPGDVLVARNPTPDIVHLMMSASAIITENGGSASHAAMIAREHKIPCIVGLLNAQKVLSEHPYVFVDTKNGVVKGVSESEKDDYLSYQRTSFTSISNIKFTDTIDLNYINKCATNSFVLSIDDSSDVSLVGGKGYNLYRLRKMNSSLFSVPPGFCVTTAAFAKFISDNISHMSSINFDLTKSDSSVSEIFSKLNFPHDVLSEIQHSYGSMKYVSVRSSATDEDSAHSTFAGLHDTFLWKKGINNVIHAIKDCYASMYTHRAIIHRSVNKIDIKKALMSVVVQRMVDADFSGVIYTALTEDIEFKGKIFSASRDIIKIEIVFGEGEGIVSGNKTPIVILAHKKTKEYWILADEDVSFLKKFLPTSAGRWFSHKKTILDNIEKLITMSTQIEKVMTNPQDIEFSFLKDRLFVLQTRDIAEELWVELT